MAIKLTNVEAANLVVRLARQSKDPAIARRAALRAANRGMGILVRRTPADTGHMRRAWRVKPLKNGARIENTAPYAGVVEFGARPHYPPWEPIIRWVARQQKVSLSGYDLSVYGRAFPIGQPKGVRGARKDFAVQWVVAMARGLVDKIGLEGQEPTHFIRKELPKLRKIFASEMAAELKRSMTGKGPKGKK
jgi:Bacteriophage HK97-gp10, putative tail-component